MTESVFPGYEYEAAFRSKMTSVQLAILSSRLEQLFELIYQIS